MVLGDIDLGDTVWQLLGTAGFLETIFEIVYVSSQASNFTKFETFFFIYTAAWELLGEMFTLLLLYGMFLPVGDDESGDATDATETGGATESAEDEERFRRLDIAKVLLRDPVHNLAHPVDMTRKDDEGSRPPATLHKVYSEHATLEIYFMAAWLGVVLPSMSVLSWAFCLPMWGMFDGEDYELRLWVCIGFWIWVFVVSLLSIKCKDDNSRSTLVFVSAYALNKATGMYLLFSRGDRLAQGFIGEGLRSLQALELGSVAIIVYRTLFTDIYAKLIE